MRELFANYALWAPGVAGGLLFVVAAWQLLRFISRQMLVWQVNAAFIRSMATNHLPHIYGALQAVAFKLGINLDPPPPVEFLDTEGKNVG